MAARGGNAALATLIQQNGQAPQYAAEGIVNHCDLGATLLAESLGQARQEGAAAGQIDAPAKDFLGEVGGNGG